MCKIVHLLRSVPPSHCQEALRFFDSRLRSQVRDGLCIPFTDTAWTQFCLPSSKGGFGLRQAVSHAPGVYLASVSRAASLDGWDPTLATGWDDAVSQFCMLSNSDPADMVVDELSQRALSTKIDDAAFQKIS